MATDELLQLLQQQIQQQQLMMQAQEKRHQEQIQVLLTLAQKSEGEGTVNLFMAALPSFSAFDSASELWTNYWARFNTFTEAHSVPSEKRASVFLTNQTPVTYKLLTNLAGQQTPPKDVNQLDIKEIPEFMIEQFHGQKAGRNNPGTSSTHPSGRSNLRFSVNSRSIGRGFPH